MKKVLFIFLFSFLIQLISKAQSQDFFEDIFLERVWLSVVNENGVYNETLIAFKPDATLGVDTSYDAEKLIGSDILSLYTKIGNDNYAIQALPSLTFDIDVPLGINSNANGPLTLALEEEMNFAAGAQLVIEDTKTGEFYNLRNEQSFTFEFDYLIDTLRFIAHFKPAPLYSAIAVTCLQSDGSIQINNFSETPWNVTIFDLDSNILINNIEVDSFVQWSQFVGGLYFISFRNEFNSMFDVAIQIENAQPVELQISPSSNVVDIANATINFSAVLSGADEIFWDFGDGTLDTSQAQTSHTFAFPGIYTVTAVAGTTGCEQYFTTVITVVGVITSIKKDLCAFSSNINGGISITFIDSFHPSLLEIFDVTGKKIHEEALNNQQQVNVDFFSLKNQMLFVRVIGKTEEFNFKYLSN